jgi:hypothetical protein
MMKMRGKPKATARFAPVAALALLAFAVAPFAAPAQAQSASDFRLPEPTPTATVRAPGPVDPENPGASTPRADPGPAPVQTVTPRPNPADGSTATPTPAAPRTAPSAAPRAVASGAVRAPIAAPPNPAGGAAGSGALPSAFPTGASGPPASDTSGSVTPSFPTLTPSVVQPSANDDVVGGVGAAWWWPYLAASAIALAGLFALLWWRQRREKRDTVAEFVMPVVAPPMPTPDVGIPPIAKLPEPQLSFAAQAESEAQPAPDVQAARLTLMLEATRLSASLMATTLSYRLTLTNHGTGALMGLAIEGDMISAHASLPPEQQMAQAGQALELRHALAVLAAGESAEFSGEIRLPLSAITPIRAGEQAYFVPLARFRVEAGGPGEDPFIVARTFVVGDVPDGPQALLRPFRLDLGPRTYSRVSQREVA